MLLALFLCTLCAIGTGCESGNQSKLYKAERKLWKIAKQQASLASLPPDVQASIQNHLIIEYQELIESLTPADSATIPPPDDLVQYRLYRIRATAQLECARWHVMAGENQKALAIIENACRSYTWNPGVTAEAFRNRILLLERMGDPDLYADAVEEMSRVLDLTRLGENIPLPLIQCQRRSARFFYAHGDVDRAGIQRQGAKDELDRLLKAGIAGSPRVLILSELALIALDTNDAESARQRYQEALEVSRGTPWEPSLEFALANLNLGFPDRLEMAVTGFERLALRHPDSPLAARGLLMAGATLRTQKEYDRADLLLDRSDSLAARDPELHASIIFERAVLAEARGDWDRALTFYRQVTADAPRSRSALNVPLQIASRYLSLHDREAAESVLQRAIRNYEEMMEGDNPQLALMAMEMRSKAWIMLEEWGAAVEALQDLAKRAPESDFAPLALAEAARLTKEKLGQLEKSHEIWQKLIDLYPGTPLAALAARELEIKQEP